MAKKKKTRKRAPSRKKGAGRPRGRTSHLAKTSTAALEKELARRERLLGELLVKRDRLLEQLNALDVEIANYESPGSSRAKRGRLRKAMRARSSRAYAGGRATRVRKRPRNTSNLVEALAKTLKSRTLSVTDVAIAVQKNGYKTTSPNFRTIVNQTLLGKKKVFKKVSRGMYTAA